jgi:hypothetical protein
MKFHEIKKYFKEKLTRRKEQGCPLSTSMTTILKKK